MSIGKSDDIPVANVNGMDNNNVSDVIGNKEDNNLAGPGNSSLYALAGNMAYYHVHGPAKVYPTLADPINIASAAASWTWGAWVELIPVDTLPEAFDIHWVHTSELSTVDNYELQLAKGGVGNEEVIGHIAFSRDSNQVQTASQPIQIPPQLAGTRVSVRLANGTAVTANTDVKIYYHEYPST